MVEAPQQQVFSFGKFEFPLLVAPNTLFLPNAVTRLFAKAVSDIKDKTVFDIGTGVGPLAIWSAFEQAKKVYAIDVLTDHCRLAEANVELNRVAKQVTVLNGSLFSPLTESLKADIIIGDVSGISNNVGRALGWYPSSVPTGGEDGASVIVALIEQAKRWLKPGGRLYFPVAIGLSDSHRIMEAARSSFASLAIRIDVYFPLTSGQFSAIEPFLPERSASDLIKRGSRITWRGQIYEATCNN